MQKIKIQAGFVFEICPTPEQELKLKQMAGNERFIYNKYKELNQKRYNETGKFIFAVEMINMLPELKKQEGMEFLQESFSQSNQQTCRHFEMGLKRFLKGESEFPKFKKKKHCNDSFTCPQKWRIEKTYVFIPKVGEVKWIKHRDLKGRPEKITISQQADKWYCSVLCTRHVKVSEKPDIETIEGVDWGISKLATVSNGDVFENPKNTKKYEKKLATAQRKLKKKKYKSKNYMKQAIKVARIHAKIANSRKDAIHKATTSIIKKSGGVAVENTANANMMQNHKLAKAVQDASPGEMKRQFKYKCQWQNKNYVEIDMFEPTTKTCSCCGNKQEMPLSKRVFVCKVCGMVMDRDLNASFNIKKKGIERLRQETTVGHTGIACGVKRGKALTMKQEKYYLEATG